MKTLHGNATTDLLDPARRTFGGHAYGLEPLTLPVDALSPDAPDESDFPGFGEDDEVREQCMRVLRAASARSAADVAPCDLVDELFWFRWITGHQLTFILWQQLTRTVAEADAFPERRKPALERAAKLVRGYSAMLLYTGSCTGEVYHRVIRPSMALHHPGFSGSWARDYGPIRTLLRGRVPPAWAGDGAELARECELNAVVHEGIAQKLVPGAPSLLQSSIGQGHTFPRDMLHVLYDTYFLTLRAPQPLGSLQLQLVRRVQAVRDDLADSGLYPSFADGSNAKRSLLHTPEVIAIETSCIRLFEDICKDAVDSL